MILSDELSKIFHPTPCLTRSLNKEEIEALQAVGAITPLSQIPKERNFSRVSTPRFKSSTFGHVLHSRRDR